MGRRRCAQFWYFVVFVLHWLYFVVFGALRRNDCCLRYQCWVLTSWDAAITRVSDAAVYLISFFCCICSSLVASRCFWFIVSDCCCLRNQGWVLTYGVAAITGVSDAAVCSFLVFYCFYPSLVAFRCFWSIVSE